MGRDQHGAATVALFTEHGLKLFDGVRIEPDHGLIYKKKRWLGQKRAANTDLLLHALGKFLAKFGALIVKLKPGKQRIRTLAPAAGKAIGPGDEFHMLIDGQKLINRRGFRNIAESALCFKRFIVVAVNGNFAFETGKPGDCLDCGRFARTVGAEQDGDAPRKNVEAQVIVGKQFAVAFG